MTRVFFFTVLWRHILFTIQFTGLNCIVLWSLTCKECSHDRVLEHFSTTERKPVPFSRCFPSPRNRQSPLCLYGFASSGHVGSIQYVVLCDRLLSLGMMVQGSSVLWHISLLYDFYCHIIFHGMDIPHLFIHSLVDDCLGCSHFPAIINIHSSSHCCEYCGQFFVDMLLFLMYVYLGVELLDHVATLCLLFWGITKLKNI